MAALIAVMEGNSVTFFQVIAVCLPASFIASMVGAFVASRQGCELKDDSIYLERLKAGLVSPSKNVTHVGNSRSGAQLSIGIFLLATVLIVLFAAVLGLKPVYESGKSMSTRDIIIVMMLASSCLMMLVGKIKPDEIVASSIFRSGMISIAVIIGIVTLGMTFVDAHLAEIKESIGGILTSYPMLLAAVLFFTCALLYSQGSTSALIIPLAVTLGVPNWAILASFVAITGIFILPTYPTSLAAMELDSTGSTRAGKYMLDHPFMLPALFGVVAGLIFGFVFASMVV